MEELGLEWEIATPEGYDDANQEALHILNVNFIGEECRARVMKFAIARVRHFHRHLPKGSSQRIRFDLRGQLVSNKNLSVARQIISDEAAKSGIRISIEFVTN